MSVSLCVCVCVWNKYTIRNKCECLPECLPDFNVYCAISTFYSNCYTLVKKNDVERNWMYVSPVTNNLWLWAYTPLCTPYIITHAYTVYKYAYTYCIEHNRYTTLIYSVRPVAFVTTVTNNTLLILRQCCSVTFFGQSSWGGHCFH